MSVEMLDAFVDYGFHTVAATPHLVGPLQPGYAERVAKAFDTIVPLARERGISLVRGFEIHLDPTVAGQLTADAGLTLGHTDIALVDLPFTEWPLHADASLFAVQAAGCRVILAHPERYPAIQDDPGKAEELVDHGVALQVTISSFSGVFGKVARRSAEELLARGLVHLVATDAHSTGRRMAAVPAGLARLRDLAGEDGLRRLTVDAPAAILANEPLPPPVRALPRPWYDRLTFWR